METVDAKLVFKKTGERIKLYVDANWTSDKSDRKSWSGLVVILAGSAIGRCTRKQSRVSLATVDAEYSYD